MPKLTSLLPGGSLGLIRKLILFTVLLTLILSIWSTHYAALKFKKIEATGIEFQESQEGRFSYMFNYEEYSKYGFSVKFIPSQNVIYFTNPPVMGNLSMSINSIELLMLENSIHGGFAFEGNAGFRFRFSTIIQILFPIVVLLLGFEGFYYKEHIKLVSGARHHNRYFFSTIVKRFLLTALTFLAIFGITKLFVVVFHGLPLSGFDFAGLGRYILVTLLTLLVFLLVGTIAGHCRKESTGFVVMAAVWGILIFIIPIITDSIRAEKGEALPTEHKLHNAKFYDINHFESKSVREKGTFKENTIETSRGIIEGFWTDVFPKVEAVDIESRNQTAAVNDAHNRLCRWFPTTFQNITAQETGSRGYGNLIFFYDYAIKLRREFVRFWIDRVFYNDPKILVSFMKEKGYSYLFTGIVPKPAYFDSGIVILFVYIFTLFCVSYILHKRSRFPLPDRAFLQQADMDIELDKGPKLSVWLDTGANFNNLLYNVFSGRGASVVKAGFKGQLFIDEVDIILENQGRTFSYIPSPGAIPPHLAVCKLFSQYIKYNKIPGDKAGETVSRPEIQSIWKRPFGHLGQSEQFDVLMALSGLKESEIYLFYDTLSGFPSSYAPQLRKRMYELKERGALVLYLTTTTTLPPDEPEAKRGFMELENWEYTVEATRMVLNSRKDNSPHGVGP